MWFGNCTCDLGSFLKVEEHMNMLERHLEVKVCHLV